MSEENNHSLKYDQKCPICGTDAILSGEDVAEKQGLRGANRIPIDDTQYAVLDNFVCLSCGYVESYIADRGILNRIERLWQRVSPDSENSTDA